MTMVFGKNGNNSERIKREGYNKPPSPDKVSFLITVRIQLGRLVTSRPQIEKVVIPQDKMLGITQLVWKIWARISYIHNLNVRIHSTKINKLNAIRLGKLG